MAEEIWKDLPGSEGKYRISTKGDCYSYYKKGLMMPDIIESGHIQYWIRINGKKKPKGAHVLVALTFIPIPDELKDLPMRLLVVHHKDGNPQNNDVDNLCWMSKQKHQELHNGKPVAQFTNGFPCELVATYTSSVEASKKTGISISGIIRCCNKVKNYRTAGGYRWAWWED